MADHSEVSISPLNVVLEGGDLQLCETREPMPR